MILQLKQSLDFCQFSSSERGACWGEEGEAGDEMRDLEGHADGDEPAKGVADEEDFRRTRRRRRGGCIFEFSFCVVVRSGCRGGRGSRSGCDDGVLNHVNNTGDESLEVWVVDVDATLAMPWEIEHDYFSAAFSEAVEEGEEVVACVMYE